MHQTAAGDGPAEYYLPPAANALVGMGTWRMKGNVDPVIEFLVARLEGAWRTFLDDGEGGLGQGKCAILPCTMTCMGLHINDMHVCCLIKTT